MMGIFVASSPKSLQIIENFCYFKTIIFQERIEYDNRIVSIQNRLYNIRYSQKSQLFQKINYNK